jgi:DNA polymerase III epsilon subunit-like protein
MIQNYDIENNILEISDILVNNNKLLYGKIVNFNMNLYDIIKKINAIDDYKLENKIKYSIEEILINKTFGGISKAYIIY